MGGQLLATNVTDVPKVRGFLRSQAGGGSGRVFYSGFKSADMAGL